MAAVGSCQFLVPFYPWAVLLYVLLVACIAFGDCCSHVSNASVQSLMELCYAPWIGVQY